MTTVPVDRFRERRVRPFCYLMIRQQTWQSLKKSDQSAVAAGLQMWESRMRFPSLTPVARRHVQASCVSHKLLRPEAVGDIVPL
jgi:phage baseplate assembly protein W